MTFSTEFKPKILLFFTNCGNCENFPEYDGDRGSSILAKFWSILIIKKESCQNIPNISQNLQKWQF